MAMVSIQHVSKVYENGFHAVKNANLEIADKEFLVIVGPSGCGKTTTLRMIAGLEEISEGTISIGNNIVNDIPAKDRNIAMVFQNYALYPHMTVYQNMAFGLTLRKYPKAEIKQRVEHTANMLGIKSQLEKKPKALSGGQRQRVALGRAIVRNPAVFLFDEPLSNLDAKLRVTTRAELKALHNRLQTTSVYVTHDQAEAMTLGDRICVMHNGEIQQLASPMKVYDKPLNRFVAGFLGTPPMNFFEGKIRFKNGVLGFLLKDGTWVAFSNEKLSAYLNRDMVLGIRPEHLRVEQFTNQDQNSIQAVVNIIEPLGDRKNVFFLTSSGDNFVANLDPHTDVQLNQQVMIYFDPCKAHIFEPGETGRNVTIPGN